MVQKYLQRKPGSALGGRGGALKGDGWTLVGAREGMDGARRGGWGQGRVGGALDLSAVVGRRVLQGRGHVRGRVVEGDMALCLRPSSG